MTSANSPSPACPLCGTLGGALHATREVARYFACGVCQLVWLDPALYLDAASELARYRTHENDPADPRYRAFLNRLMAPLLPHLRPGARGLDFGSGPGPTLSLMLTEAGFSCTDYDPYFAPYADRLSQQYDFVTCSETAEHFQQPAREFALLASLLRPGGWLAIMTQMLPADQDFAEWYYPRDPTHVVFYQPATFHWLARHYGWQVQFPAPHVVLCQAP